MQCYFITPSQTKTKKGILNPKLMKCKCKWDQIRENLPVATCKLLFSHWIIIFVMLALNYSIWTHQYGLLWFVVMLPLNRERLFWAPQIRWERKKISKMSQKGQDRDCWSTWSAGKCTNSGKIQTVITVSVINGFGSKLEWSPFSLSPVCPCCVFLNVP